MARKTVHMLFESEIPYILQIHIDLMAYNNINLVII